MKLKIKTLAIMFATTIVGTLVACGDSEETMATDVRIQVASRFGADLPNDHFYRDQIAAFNELDNGIQVEMVNITTESEYLNMLRTSFANGDTPNAFIEFGGSRVVDYLEANALVNMESYFDANPEWYQSFYPSMFHELTFDGFDGIWGVPFQSYMVVLYYNTELFEAHGLTPPRSFDELFEVSEQFLEAGVLPFQVGARDAWRLGHLHSNIVLSSLGVDAVKQLANRTLSYDSPEMLETFQIIADMYEKGFLGEDILNTDYNTEKARFAVGDVAMRWDGTRFISEIFGTEAFDRTGVVSFPYVNPKFADVAQGGPSDMWFVSQLNKTEEEITASVEFVKFMTSQEFFAGNNEVASDLFPAEFVATPNTPENALLETVKEIVAGKRELRPDLQNHDPEPHMLDTVRNSLQGIPMGNTPERVAQDILGKMR